MKIAILIGCAVALSPGLAVAQSYDQGAAGYPFEQPHGYSPQGAPERLKHPLASGNECGPDRPVPIWSATNAFLGYGCETPPSNGGH